MCLMADMPLRRQMGIAAKAASASYAIEDVARQWKELFDSLMTAPRNHHV